MQAEFFQRRLDFLVLTGEDGAASGGGVPNNEAVFFSRNEKYSASVRSN